MEVALPKLSDSMEEGTIIEWLKDDGAPVTAGEPLVEIETDKADMVYEAPAGGTLEILVQVGDTVAVGAPIARLGEGEAATVVPPAHAAPTPARGDAVLRPFSSEQQVVVRRMTASRAEVPEFTAEVEVDAAACVAARERRKAAGSSAVPSLNDYVVRASALALRAHPLANSRFTDAGIETFERVNVGVAVAAPGRLVVPTVFDADSKTVDEIAAEVRRLAERVRSETVTPPELDGATFTVSNLGMYGLRRFAAIINPPQAAILAVGAVTERPVARAGAVVVRPIMSLTLACDHRVLYGADAAQFLATLRETLEGIEE
jgi:pyruvate dehydrogenase E2 component (dihydrolipoamide acetyltransferase)